MKMTDLASISPEPSLSSSETMEELFKKVTMGQERINWEDLVQWVEVVDALNSLALTAEPISNEEASRLWGEYADSKTLGPHGTFQSYFIDPSSFIPDVEGLPDPEEP